MRLSEVYTSVQGEGPRVGVPTQFTRFGGCNLRCPGWPCDTQHAIDPAYRTEWGKWTPEDVFNKVEAWPRNICFTGGEPFLQHTKELDTLTQLLLDHDYTIECFSNGTLRYPDWAFDRISFVMDWKLDGSGEDPLDSIRFDNLSRLGPEDAIKFTIADEKDFFQAVALYRRYVTIRQVEERPQVYAGIVWGKMENADLIEMMLANELNWKFNIQIHNHVWDREKRGI